MLKKLAAFADNTQYFDPVSTSRLLSNKEVFKGRVLPLLLAAGTFSLSMAICVFTSGLGGALQFLALSSAIVTVIAVHKNKKLSREYERHKSYDLNSPQACEDFSRAYPVHKQLPHTIKTLFQSAHLPTLPVITITGRDSGTPAIFENAVLNKNRKTVLLLPDKFLKDATAMDVASICAHETGHVHLGHTRGWQHIAHSIPDGMHIYAGFALMASTGFITGAAYLLASISLRFIAKAKMSQYDERQCDRFAFKHTGIGLTTSALFRGLAKRMSTETSDRLKNHPLLKIADTFNALAGSHPRLQERADYHAALENNNPVHARTMRTKIGY